MHTIPLGSSVIEYEYINQAIKDEYPDEWPENFPFGRIPSKGDCVVGTRNSFCLSVVAVMHYQYKTVLILGLENPGSLSEAVLA